jgi:hypothetical protein
LTHGPSPCAGPTGVSFTMTGILCFVRKRNGIRQGIRHLNGNLLLDDARGQFLGVRDTRHGIGLKKERKRSGMGHHILPERQAGCESANKNTITTHMVEANLSMTNLLDCHVL